MNLLRSRPLSSKRLAWGRPRPERPGSPGTPPRPAACRVPRQCPALRRRRARARSAGRCGVGGWSGSDRRKSRRVRRNDSSCSPIFRSLVSSATSVANHEKHVRPPPTIPAVKPFTARIFFSESPGAQGIWAACSRRPEGRGQSKGGGPNGRRCEDRVRRRT